MIKVNNVCKKIRNKVILQDVSLNIKQGEIYGLLGLNGAGKSTLLSILATVRKADSGQIFINGLNLSKEKKSIRHCIGYVPQDIALFEQLSVKENMLFWNQLCKNIMTEDELKAICANVQLTDKWTEKVAHLSGGMKRKLNIAVALIHDPQILLMDEPTVGIDIGSKWEINQFVKSLAARGKTIVYTSHDAHEIATLCERIAVLQNGSITYEGSLQALKTKFVHITSDEQLIYELLQNHEFGIER